MVNYTEAIKRPFTDGKKFLIGVLLNILPIVNLLVVGYTLECAKSAMKKKYKLPEWENWGDYFVKGLLATIIGFIYMIPALMLLLIGFITIAGSVIWQAFRDGSIDNAEVFGTFISASPWFIGAVVADEIFTILMSTEVEPRRNFIFKYAKQVKNLDV